MYQNGYEQYEMQSVNTMTRGEILLLLYDELIKRLNRAQLALDTEEYDLFEKSAARCGEIIQYLKTTLNMEYEISRELRRMYDFFLYEIARLRAGRNAEIIQELKPLVVELRDAFKEADRTSGV